MNNIAMSPKEQEQANLNMTEDRQSRIMHAKKSWEAANRQTCINEVERLFPKVDTYRWTQTEAIVWIMTAHWGKGWTNAI